LSTFKNRLKTHLFFFSFVFCSSVINLIRSVHCMAPL